MPAFDEQDYTKSFRLDIWKGMLPFLKPYRKTLITVILLNLFSAAIDIALPLFQSYAINNYIKMRTTEGIAFFIALYVLVVVVQTVFVIMFTRRSMRIEMNLGRDMKRACFVHLQTLGLSYYNTTPVGYILARVMSDTNRIAGMVAWGLIDMMWAVMYVIGVFIAMLILNPSLAVIIMLIVPAIVLLTIYFQKRILHWNRKVRKINSKITSAYNEGITGAKTSKTLTIEGNNFRDFQEITSEMRHAGIRAARLSAIYIPLVLHPP